MYLVHIFLNDCMYKNKSGFINILPTETLPTLIDRDLKNRVFNANTYRPGSKFRSFLGKLNRAGIYYIKPVGYRLIDIVLIMLVTMISCLYQPYGIIIDCNLDILSHLTFV